MSDSRLLSHRYEAVRQALEEACSEAGRKRDELTLVAVSKFHPAEDIKIVADCGQLDFGENYLQEAQSKKEALSAEAGLRWHMIGHVQGRKASAVAGNFTLVHTLDSMRLADGMERALALNEKKQDVLIEVNIGEEAQKAGVAINDVEKLAEHVLAACPHLNLRGLMCLPPVYDSGDAARPYFARLHNIRDALSKNLGQPLSELSMGMSGDFRAAIQEGATIVRIGTDIFGSRPVRAPL